MNKKHFVITVERQYGSGGRLTGKRLAEELGIHFYDEEILKMTSETSAIGEQYYRLADEKAGNNLLYRIVTGMKPDLGEPVRDGDNITSPENLFRFQSSVIRKLAGQESCIIVGRCGNYVLQDQLDDVIRIFVYADTVTRVRRVIEVDQVDEKEALRRMKRIDEQSAENLKADFKADDLLPLGEDAASQARYLENYACCPAYTNTETEYFALGDLAFPRMLEELRKREDEKKKENEAVRR